MVLLVPFRALVPILGRGERRVVLDGLQPDLLGQHHGPLRMLPPHQLRRHSRRKRATRGNGKLLEVENNFWQRKRGASLGNRRNGSTYLFYSFIKFASGWQTQSMTSLIIYFLPISFHFSYFLCHFSPMGVGPPLSNSSRISSSLSFSGSPPPLESSSTLLRH